MCQLLNPSHMQAYVHVYACTHTYVFYLLFSSHEVVGHFLFGLPIKSILFTQRSLEETLPLCPHKLWGYSPLMASWYLSCKILMYYCDQVLEKKSFPGRRVCLFYSLRRCSPTWQRRHERRTCGKLVTLCLLLGSQIGQEVDLGSALHSSKASSPKCCTTFQYIMVRWESSLNSWAPRGHFLLKSQLKPLPG